jgi:hypothetical protein
VVRNPYDNVATIATRAGVGLEMALSRYERFVRCNARVKAGLEKDEVFEYRHEEFISNPSAVLTRMCGYLGLDAPQEYLKGCAAIVFESPKKSRHKVEWPVEIKGRVERLIGEVEFLNGYGFER